MNQSGKEFESQMTNRNEQYKIEFSGIILSVQPRSNVWRYRLDNRTHSMTGYNIFLSGIAEGDERDFAIAISEKQQQNRVRAENSPVGRERLRLFGADIMVKLQRIDGFDSLRGGL